MAEKKMDLPTEILVATLNYNSKISILAAAWAGNYDKQRNGKRFDQQLKAAWDDHTKTIDKILQRHGEQTLSEAKK